jgi:hypothetical protein
MKTQILNNLLDFRYATPNNLSSRTAGTEKGATVQLRVDLKWLLDRNFITKVDNDVYKDEAMRKQFYKITRAGAEYVDRKDEYRKVDNKASSSIPHEKCKIDICKSFKEFYGADKFEYNVIPAKGIKPDIVIHTPYKVFVEIEVKDNQSKVLRVGGQIYD